MNCDEIGSSPLKRPQRLENLPRYTQICATGYDLGRNRLMGITVSSCTQIRPYRIGKPPWYSQNRATYYD